MNPRLLALTLSLTFPLGALVGCSDSPTSMLSSQWAATSAEPDAPRATRDRDEPFDKFAPHETPLTLDPAARVSVSPVAVVYPVGGERPAPDDAFDKFAPREMPVTGTPQTGSQPIAIGDEPVPATHTEDEPFDKFEPRERAL